MKVLLACVIVVSALFIVFKHRSIIEPMQHSVASHSPSAILKDTISFVLQIQPILVNRCSPCHFPGGKMYERLPFDKEATIVNHEIALLRRINDEKEKALIQRFIGEQKK